MPLASILDNLGVLADLAVLDILAVLENLENLENLEQLEQLETPENPERAPRKRKKEGTAPMSSGPFFVISSRVRRLVLAAERLNLLEEVVSLVVYEDEGGEVLYLNLPDGFHAEFGELYALNALDVVLREDGGRTTN